MRSVAPSELKIGIYIAQGDGSWAQYASGWDQILEVALAAEQADLDSVWIADHMVFEFEGVPIQGRWECWTILAALAAQTSKITLGSLVACTAFRNPALLAKTAETVDEISKGRLILGLGAGWHEPEFRTFGFPFDHRASRFEEAFTIIHGLIRDGNIDFTGKYETAPECHLRPRGPRFGALPLLVGTDGPRLLKLTARDADIWNTNWTRSASEIAPRVDAVERACEEVGRDPDSLGKSACVFLDLEGAQGIWSPQGTSTPHPLSINEAAHQLSEYASMGIDHVMVWLDPDSPDSVYRAGEVLTALRT